MKVETYVHGNANGEATVYHANGELKEKYINKRGKIHGEYIAFHEDGKKAVTGQYILGMKNGLWQYFDENGNLIKEESYKRNKLTSEKTVK